MKPFLTILLLVCFLPGAARAQNSALGSWQTHFSPLSGRQVIQVNGRIFYNTYNGLFSIDPQTREVRSWSKAEGLSDSGISAFEFQEDENLLIIAYRSGLVDFVYLDQESNPEQIIPWPELSQTPGITGSRAVNKIVLQGNLAYLCTGFGIILVDIQSRQVEEAYRYIGAEGAQVAVTNVTFSNDSIFAATSVGLLAASRLPTVNRQYFANWKSISSPGRAAALAFFENKIYAAFSGQGLFYRNGASWKEVFRSTGANFSIQKLENSLLVTEPNQIRSISPEHTVTALTDPQFQTLSAAIRTTQQVYWIADTRKGILTNQFGDFEQIASAGADTTISPRPDSIIIDAAGATWARIPGYLGGGISVKNAAGQQRILTTGIGTGSLPSNQINSLALDNDGYIWFASDKGAGYLIPDGLFESSRIDAVLPVYGQRRLFSTEKCTAIAVEPGNRKWIATQSGIYLFNADGTELLANFNVNNSPLPSNQITALRMEAASGKLFIDTPNGMVSYVTGSSAPEDNLNQVTIFPNPVRPDYGGQVGFKGLMAQSSLKITELSGRLIYETRSQGGTATWNLLDYTGKRARGGIYMVFIVSGDGTEKLAGKLAVID